MRIAASVMVVVLGAGGCAPRAKPVAYVAGIVLSAVAAGFFMKSAGTTCPPDEQTFLFIPTEHDTCEAGRAIEKGFGTVLLTAGLATLLAGVLSPSADTPASSAAPVVAPPTSSPPVDDPPEWPRASLRLGFD